MPFIKVGEENSGSINLYYEDHGEGKPVLLIHGWPLSGASWEKQVAALLQAGHRVITYDRRGFGRSSQPSEGYNYDTFAEDLDKVITELNLSDITLVGFSMGTGEVVRYLGKFGSKRISKAVFMGVLPPFLLKTADNPEGVDASVFADIKKSIIADRPKFIYDFLMNFFNFDVFGGKRISDRALEANWNVAIQASAKGTLDCVSAWLEDFRKDVPHINVPSLLIHGDGDRILPLAATATRLAKGIKDSKLVVIEGAPHGLAWTHADRVNEELLKFVGKGEEKRPRSAKETSSKEDLQRPRH